MLYLCQSIGIFASNNGKQKVINQVKVKIVFRYIKIFFFFGRTESNISSESSNEEFSDQDSEREDEILMVGLNESEVAVQSPSTSNMYVKRKGKKIENSFESSENNNLTYTNVTESRETESNKRPYSPTISKKSKTKSTKNETAFENKLIDYLRNRPREETDPDKLFLLSLLPQIKQLSQDKKNSIIY